MLRLDMDERIILDRAKRFLNDPLITIYDVGAAHGHWSMLAEELMYGRELRFHLFEGNINHAAELIPVCDKPTWELIHCAVTAPVRASRGFVSFDLNALNGEHSSIVLSDEFVSGVRKIVPAVTLDDYSNYTQAYPNLIKIDAEGSELDIIVGATSTIAKHRPVIQFEYGGQWAAHRKTWADAYGVFAAINYSVLRVNEVDASFTVVPDIGAQTNDYEMKNMVALPNEKVDRWMNE